MAHLATVPTRTNTIEEKKSPEIPSTPFLPPPEITPKLPKKGLPDFFKTTPEEFQKMDKAELLSSLAFLAPGQLQFFNSDQTKAFMSRLNAQELLVLQQAQITGVLKNRDTQIQQQIKNRDNLQKEYDSLWMPTWASNSTKAKLKEIEAQDAMISALRKSRDEIAKALTKSKEESAAGFLLMKNAAKRGATDPLTAEAADRLTRSSRALFDTKLAVDYSETQRLLGQSGDLYRRAADNWGTLYNGMESGRNVCIGVVAGGVATLAAPIVFTAAAAAGASTLVAGGATLVAGAGVGTATAVTVGGVSRGYENALAVNMGQRTDEEARVHMRQGVLADARSGVISGVGGGAGGVIGHLLNRTGAVLPIATRIRHGAIRGAGSTAATVPTAVGFKIHDAYAEIAAIQIGSALKPEDLDLLKTQIFAKHRLTADTLLKDGAIDLAVSAVTGAAGARFDVSRTAAKGLFRNAAIEAVEFSSQTTTGLGKVVLKGEEFSRENIANDVISNVISGFQGRVQSPRKLTVPLRVQKPFEQLGYLERSRVLNERNPLDPEITPKSPDFTKHDLRKLRFMRQPGDVDQGYARRNSSRTDSEDHYGYKEMIGNDAEQAYARLTGGRVNGGIGDRGVDVCLPANLWDAAGCRGFQVKSSLIRVLEHVERGLLNGSFIPVTCGDAPRRGKPREIRLAALLRELREVGVWISPDEKAADPVSYEKLVRLMPKLLELPLANHVAPPKKPS
jgi:hypothetical protein